MSKIEHVVKEYLGENPKGLENVENLELIFNYYVEENNFDMENDFILANHICGNNFISIEVKEFGKFNEISFDLAYEQSKKGTKAMYIFPYETETDEYLILASYEKTPGANYFNYFCYVKI